MVGDIIIALNAVYTVSCFLCKVLPGVIAVLGAPVTAVKNKLP